MEKINRAFILTVLTIFVHWCAYAQEDALAVRLQEAQVIIDTLREENRSLLDENAKKEQQLADLNSKYAELILKTDAMVNEMTELRLSASHLIRTATENTEIEKDSAAELLQIVALARREQQELAEATEKHFEKVNAVLNALSPSPALREEMDASIAQLREKIQQATRPLSLSALVNETASSCSILKADVTTGVVVLDQGLLHGVRPGSQYILQRGGQIATRLNVIESRPLHSAAIIVEGDKSAAVPGTLLKRAEQ